MSIPDKELLKMVNDGIAQGLTPKQAKLVAHYVADTETVGNKTQSALKAYDTVNHDTARLIATDTLRKPTVRTYMQQLLESLDMGVEVRSKLLGDMAKGTLKTRKKVTQRDRDGTVVATQEIESDVAPSVRLKALAEMNKLDGSTEIAAAEVRIAEREYTAHRKQLLKDAGLK